MCPSHLMTFDQAAARLGTDEAGIDALIEAGVLTTQPWMGDVYLLAEEVEARGASAAPDSPEPAPKPRREPDDHRIRSIRNLLTIGVQEVRAAKVRELLGIGQTQVCKIAREGRINYIERSGRRWYLLEDVETYARLQNVWDSKTGGWTAYGKQDEPSREQDMKLLSSARERWEAVSPVGAESEDYALDTKQVLSILNLKYSRIRQLVKRGELTVEYDIKEFDNRDSRGRRNVKRVPRYSARQVYALADKRDRKHSQAGFTASEWKERMVKPLIRTKIEAPPNDILVTRAEAANMLGISAKMVGNLVRKGRLFGWQEEPGKPHSPLFLSGNQVVRYRDNPDRQKRSAAAKRGRRLPSPLGQETNGELWLEENGMADGIRLASKSNLDRQHGDFLNTQQAAKLLGITPKSLCNLRARGRIAGYQRPRIKRDKGGHKWWFYRREDVDRLLLDREYKRNRDRGRVAKLHSMGRCAPGDELSW